MPSSIFLQSSIMTNDLKGTPSSPDLATQPKRKEDQAISVCQQNKSLHPEGPQEHCLAKRQDSHLLRQRISSMSDDKEWRRSASENRFIQDILETLLSCATSRPAPQHSSTEHQFSRSLGNTTLHTRTDPGEENVKTTDTSLRKFSNADFPLSPKISTSGTDLGYPESDDESKLPTSHADDSRPETKERAQPHKRKEQNSDKTVIPRPSFVITEQHTLIKLGTISAVLQDAVVVTTFNLAKPPSQFSDADIRSATALDTGSLLCFSDGRILGKVFETFGPVATPLYVVRFNNSDEIPASARVGVDILYVEQEMRLVRGQDIRGKGYDTSGKEDEEVETEEFSDDEMEQQAKRKKRSRVRDQERRPLKRERPDIRGDLQARNERLLRPGESNTRIHVRKHSLRDNIDSKPGTEPIDGRRFDDSRRYNPRTFGKRLNGMRSTQYGFMPRTTLANGIFADREVQAATIPPSHASQNSLGLPSPMMNLADAAPGSAPHEIHMGRNCHLPSALPTLPPPYTTPSTTQQVQHIYPNQSWRAQTNMGLTQHRPRLAPGYERYLSVPIRTGPVLPFQSYHYESHNFGYGLPQHMTQGYEDTAGRRPNATASSWSPHFGRLYDSSTEQPHYRPPG